MILVVSHGLAIRRFLTVVTGCRPEDLGFLGNCGIAKLRYEDGKFAVEAIIDPNVDE